MNDEDILTYQMITSIIFAGTIIISIILTYNERQRILNKETIFNNEDALDISLINRIVILILLFVYLYLNYEDFKSNKDRKDYSILKLQFYPSILSIIAAIIVLYIAFYNKKRNTLNISSIENPFV